MPGHLDEASRCDTDIKSGAHMNANFTGNISAQLCWLTLPTASQPASQSPAPLQLRRSCSGGTASAHDTAHAHSCACSWALYPIWCVHQ